MFISAAKQDMGRAIEEAIKVYENGEKKLPAKTKMVLRSLNGGTSIPKEIILKLMHIGKDKLKTYAEPEKEKLLEQLLEQYDKGELNNNGE